MSKVLTRAKDLKVGDKVEMALCEMIILNVEQDIIRKDSLKITMSDGVHKEDDDLFEVICKKEYYFGNVIK